MTQCVTYIRGWDRTRLIFVFDEATPEEAVARAARLAPPGFRLAAVKPDHEGPLEIPADGDNYGQTCHALA